jgi:hypothetical protein
LIVVRRDLLESLNLNIEHVRFDPSNPCSSLAFSHEN